MRALWAARSDRYARPVRAQQMLAGPPLPEAAGVGALTFGGFLTEVGDRYRDNEALVFDDPAPGARPSAGRTATSSTTPAASRGRCCRPASARARASGS
jgi:hypothetical protein